MKNEKIFVCEICGKEHNGTYGSGRFCSNHCRHVFIIGRQTKIHVCNFKAKRALFGTWKCNLCNEIFETKKKLLEHNQKYHLKPLNISWNKGLTIETSDSLRKRSETLKRKYKNGELLPSFKGKKHSKNTKEKISKSRKKYLELHPEKTPYLLDHSSKISNAERFFISFFEKENINLKYHKQVSIYQLDFYNDEFKFYVEIDGVTHNLQEVKLKDEKRTKFLESIGWRGTRIKWPDFKNTSYNEQQKIINDIKSFLS